MTHNALIRYRRPLKPDPTLRLIAFELRHNRFCLPLVMARRVVFCPAANLAPGAGLLKLNQEHIPLVELARWVYRAAPLLPEQSSPAPAPLTEARQVDPGSRPTGPPVGAEQTVVVVESSRLGPLGLLVDGIPSLKRAKASAFSPVPMTYLQMNHMQGVTTLVTLGNDEPPLLLLEIDTLWPPVT